VARIGYTASIDPTSGTSVADTRTFFSNLTTWTLGSLEVFQAATTSERNYYVLSHNVSSAEILIVQCPPGGTATTLDTSTLAAYQADDAVVQTDGAFQNALGFAYSPGGGYLTGFTGGFDPASDASFWPSDSSWVWPIDFWQEFRGPSDPVRVYMLEDDAHAEWALYDGLDSTSNNGYAFHIVSDELITLYAGETYQTNGVFYKFRVLEAGPQTTSTSAFTLYDATSTPENFTQTLTTGTLTGLNDTNQPAGDGSYLTREFPVLPEGGGRFLGTLNASRECGRMTSTYGTIRGGVFVHLYEDYFDPWASNLVVPPITN